MIVACKIAWHFMFFSVISVKLAVNSSILDQCSSHSGYGVVLLIPAPG